jgi:hypothetical protein
MRTEAEFLNINLTEVSRHLLRATHSPFYWLILKKPLALKTLTKNRETRKFETIHE